MHRIVLRRRLVRSRLEKVILQVYTIVQKVQVAPLLQKVQVELVLALHPCRPQRRVGRVGLGLALPLIHLLLSLKGIGIAVSGVSYHLPEAGLLLVVGVFHLSEVVFEVGRDWKGEEADCGGAEVVEFPELFD